MALKTLGSRVFAAATFAAFTLHGADTPPPPSGVAPPAAGGSAGRAKIVAVQSDPTYHDAVRRSQIRQEDEELLALVSVIVEVIS